MSSSKLSIIVGVYNQLPMNVLFYKKLVKYTHFPFELIIIDNGSVDGSAEFFTGVNARVIRNEGNFSYPYCQNQGIRAANHDLLAFLNNDIIVAPDWDKHLLEAMDEHGLEVITSCGIDRLQTRDETEREWKKWAKIKKAILHFGCNAISLRLMHLMMYGGWESFCSRRHRNFGNAVQEGFVGHTVLMKRSALEKIGLWDERIYKADYDLFLRCKQRHRQHGDIKPVHMALGVFNHHYMKLTLNATHPEFRDKSQLIPLEKKWPWEDRIVFFRNLN